MKNIKNLIGLATIMGIFAVSMLVSSCNDDNNIVSNDPIYTTHFIQIAQQLTDFRISASNSRISLDFRYGTRLTGEDFDNFLSSIGDTSYNRKINVSYYNSPAVVDTIVRLDVTSNAQFLDIPAGESLAKYIVFRGQTIWPYIESGYSIIGDWSPVHTSLDYKELYTSSEIPEYHPIVKQLDQVSDNELYLLDFFPSLRFTDIPEIKEHTFTISITTNDRTISKSVDLVFNE